MSLDHVANLYRPGMAVHRGALSNRTLLVLGWLAFRANRTKDRHGNPPDVAPVTPQQIARAMCWNWDGGRGTTARRVRRAVAELVAQGLVARVPNADPRVHADALLLLPPLSDSYKTGSGGAEPTGAWQVDT